MVPSWREDDRVNVALVAWAFADGCAVGGAPEAEDAVVAAAGDERAVRADGHGADPAFMGVRPFAPVRASPWLSPTR